MKAVTYQRKSTQAERGVSGDSLSVERQRELARAFATARGWEVVADFADDAFSGADFTNREGLARLLAAAQQTPRPFDCVIAMDESRIGRDQYRTGYVLQQLADAGVQLWYYQDAREAQLDSAVGKFMESVRSFGAELEREKGKARTREALRKNARDGHVPSGRAYGYRNVREGAHAKRVIHEPEAQTLRRIFELIAEGWGLHRIVRLLNDEGCPAPNRNGWAPTSIRAMLTRPLYRGQVTYGKTRRVDRGGRQHKVAVPEPDWITREAPELRIVPEALWRAAHARLEKTREVYDGLRTRSGTLRGRPESGLLSKHLLAGFLQCGQCGGNLFVQPSRSQGPRGKIVLYYRCTTHWKWGNKRCTMRWGVPYVIATERIIAHFRERFLHPQALGDQLQDEMERRRQAPAERQGRLDALRDEVKRLDGELVRLVEAVATGGQISALVSRMQTSQRQRDELAAQLEHLEGQQEAQETFDIAEWVEQTRELLTDLGNTLGASPQNGRMVLRGLLATPITMSPVLDEDGKLTDWEYLATGTFDQLVAGRLSEPSKPIPTWPYDLVIAPKGVTIANTTPSQPGRRAAPARSWWPARSTTRARGAPSLSWP